MTILRSRNITAASRERARELRRHATPVEQHLWYHLRAHNLSGLKFRRQHPIGGYIVDLCCVQAGTVIEIDGDSHAECEAYDQARTHELNMRGYHVIRFTNAQVMSHTEAVLEQILAECQSRIGVTPPPTPPPRGVGIAQAKQKRSPLLPREGLGVGNPCPSPNL